MATTTTNPVFGGILLPTRRWLTIYDGCREFANVLPSGETDPWTRHATGVVTETLLHGILTTTDLADGSGLYYDHDLALSNETGSILDARCQINAGSSAVNTGALMVINDGTYQACAWLRPDGVNLQERENCAVDMTYYRRVRLVLKGLDVALYIDDRRIDYGPLSGLTSDSQVAFGTKSNYGYATVQWDYVRARCMLTSEVLKEATSIVTIGPICGTIADLSADSDGDSWLVLDVDHSDTATFSFAEVPIFTDGDGDSLEDKGVLVEFICDVHDSEGTSTGFKVKFTNFSYSGDSYGSALTDIGWCWTRRGMVTV